MIGLLGLVAGTRAAGCRTLIVRSGSMTGTADTGSLVVARPLDAADAKVGDVILIERVGPHGAPVVPVLHRIIERRVDEGRIIVRTKGDANPSADPGSYELAGPTATPMIVVPLLGYAIAKAQTPAGWFGLVVLPLVAFTISALRRLWSTDRDTERRVPDASELALP
jgi:signal peptidase I